MPQYTLDEAREAVAASFSYAEALRKLGLRPAGGNHRLFRHHVDEVWRLPTDHFDPDRSRRKSFRQEPAPLEAVLVEHSTYSRGTLKRRLFEAGLKSRVCELCGQGEEWRGGYMALILDHINGIGDDNRLENLRIVCPNCAATLETHCGRKNRVVAHRSCGYCGSAFTPKVPAQKYCSRYCGVRHRGPAGPRVGVRKVERPPYEQLLAEVEALGWSGVGRKYGVSHTAVRNWVRRYRASAAGSDPGSVDGAAEASTQDTGAPPSRGAAPFDDRPDGTA